MIPFSCAASSASATWRAQSESLSQARQRPAQGLALHQLQHQAIHIAGFFQAVDGRDIGMVQRSQRTRLAAEARQPLRVARELSGQSLDGDIAAELAVVRAIYLAHAAGAQRRHDPIRSELPAQERSGSRRRDRRVLDCGCFKEAPGLFFLRQQQFDLPPQVGVSTACNVEQCLPRFWRTLQSRVEEFLHSPPTFLAHG